MPLTFSAWVVFGREFSHTCNKCHCVVYSHQFLQVSDDVRNMGSSVDTEREREKKNLPKGWLYLQATDFHEWGWMCVLGEGSSKCVNPFFLVAVAGPPSCFSPHIITILFLLYPLVTRPCTHSTSNPLVCLQRASWFYEQSGHTHSHVPHVHSHTYKTHCLLSPYFASCNL